MDQRLKAVVAAQQRAEEAEYEAMEKLEAMSESVDVPDTFVRSLAHVERAGDSIARGVDAALSSHAAGSVVKGVEGALGSLANAAEGTAGLLGGVGGARGRPTPRGAEPSGVAGAQRFDERVRAMEAEPSSFTLPSSERAAFARFDGSFVHFSCHEFQ